nr:calcium sensing receptor, chloroplastic isoform X1 [Ipomoea batatas]
MGKNQAYKAMQRARLGSSSAAPEEIEDGMVDGSFHTPEWHAARLASLKTSHTITWEEFKRKQKEEEIKKGEIEADKDKMMREYRAQLDAERAIKLAKGRNHSSSKHSHKKDKKDKDSKKHRSKKRKLFLIQRSRRSSDYSSSSSSSESSSSDEEDRESRKSRSKSKRKKKEKKHRSRSKHSDNEEGEGPLPLSRFFGTTACCSSHSQITINNGLRSFSSYWKTCDVKCSLVDWSYGVQLQSSSFRGQLNASLCSNFVEKSGRLGSTDSINVFYDQTELNGVNYLMREVNDYPSTATRHLKFVDSSSGSIGEEELTDFTNNLVANADPPIPESITTDVIQDNSAFASADVLTEPVIPESATTLDAMQSTSASDSLSIDASSLSGVKTSAVDAINEMNKSINSSFEKAQNFFNDSLDAITSSINSAAKDVSGTFDDAIGKMTSTVDKTGGLASDTVSGFSSDLKNATGKVGTVAIDTLRQAILVAEGALSQGATLVVYAYGSVKELLPPEIHDVLNLSEEKAIKFLSPVGAAFQQVYVSLEGLEKIIGLDPSDPIVPFVLFLGVSTTLWGTYLVLTYGGYAGDLSPESTMQLLVGKENAVLIDIRPEARDCKFFKPFLFPDFRERDGIPDLRRAARFRYANVTLPEVDGSMKKLFKSGRDLENALLAAVIRDLKIVKRPYLMQGGFRSWIKEGLRIKELKPETTLTILNEEAEAILEKINPTPLKLLGFGTGLIVAVYAALEWETTLQLIGFIGLFLTIYLRFASYEGSEDLKQDIRLLFVPVRLGGQAISWAVGKLEKNGNGLPTSPSSTDVQSRVLQAAAKHESQPSDNEDIKDPSPGAMASVNESVDLSEA